MLDGLEFAQPFSAFVTTDFQAFAGGSSYRARSIASYLLRAWNLRRVRAIGKHLATRPWPI